MGENWHTGFFYKVKRTGRVGEQIECPCDDPIILEFKYGHRDAYFLREVEPTTARITESGFGITPTGRNGRPKGIELRTINKMMEIYRFLEKQDKPVYRAAIEKSVGFNITRPLMTQKSYPPHTVTMESLGIVERVPGERTWVAWRLTKLGRRAGEKIIKSQYKEKI